MWNIVLFSEDINPAFAEIPRVIAGILPKGRVHNSTWY